MAGLRMYVITVTGTLVEVEPDNWRACTNQWNLVAYGKSRLEADLRMDYAVSMMLRSMFKRMPRSEFRNALKKAGARLRTQSFTSATRGEVSRRAEYTTSDIETARRVNFRRDAMVVGANS